MSRFLPSFATFGPFSSSTAFFSHMDTRVWRLYGRVSRGIQDAQAYISGNAHLTTLPRAVVRVLLTNVQLNVKAVGMK